MFVVKGNLTKSGKGNKLQDFLLSLKKRFNRYDAET